MKRRAFTLLALSVAACSAAANDADTSAADISGADPATGLDDAFARDVLAGGCQVQVGNRTVTTDGTGGACPTTLSGILDLFAANAKAKGAFGGGFTPHVVSEQGDQPTKANYRFVISENSDSQVFVATVSGGGEVSEDGVEAIGFSPSLEAYVFYKNEGGRWIRKGDASMVKPHAENAQPAFECVRCHATGAPLMKEIHDSWGNWTSTWFSIQQPAQRNPLFERLFTNAQIADELERKIIDGIHRHSKGRVDRAKKEGQLAGIMTQLMCDVGEPSLIGSHESSPTRMGKVSGNSIGALPGSILLNQLLVVPQTGGTFVERGLEQSISLAPASNTTLTAPFGAPLDMNAYSDALVANGQTIGGEPGDTIFPMASPEKSYADLDAVQELVRQGLVDLSTLGAVLMTDFTVSTFSDARCKLAATLPATWTNAADLARQWTPTLASSHLRGAAGLATRLGAPDMGQGYVPKLETFTAACLARSNNEKATFTQDMIKIVSQRRREFEQKYPNVIESDWLIPQDKLGSKPHAIRLNATTCQIEAQSAPFDGE